VEYTQWSQDSHRGVRGRRQPGWDTKHCGRKSREGRGLAPRSRRGPSHPP